VDIPSENAWSVYVGSLANATSPGTSLYALAKQMCQEFATCPTGKEISQVNLQLSLDWVELKLISQIETGDGSLCPETQDRAKNIIKLMKIPMIQYLIRSIFLLDQARTANDASLSSQHWVEAWSVASALLPEISFCSASLAQSIRSNLALYNSVPLLDAPSTLVEGLVQAYSCLGLNCAKIGGFQGRFPCQDPIPVLYLSLASFPFSFPSRSLQSLSQIDLDIRIFNQLLDQNNFDGAISLYTTGSSSFIDPATNTKRSLSSLSKQADLKVFTQFYASPTPMDDFLLQALKGLSAFGKQQAFQRESSRVGAVALTIWPTVLRKLQEGYQSCVNGTQNESLVLIDEAWSYFTGSSLFSASTGYSLYSLNEQLCSEFGTCPQTVSYANDQTLALMNSLQTAAKRLDCTRYEDVKSDVEAQSMIPLIQGLIKHSYELKQSSNASSWAKGWTFAYALLPYLDQCDSSAATLVKQNFDLSNENPMISGFDLVSTTIYKTLPCLQLTCENIGSINEASFKNCQTVTRSFDRYLDGVTIASVICSVIFVVFVVFVIIRARRTSRKPEFVGDIQMMEARISTSSRTLGEAVGSQRIFQHDSGLCYSSKDYPKMKNDRDSLSSGV
jgi:hypothetical protein